MCLDTYFLLNWMESDNSLQYVIGSEKRYIFRKIMKIELLIPGCSKFIGELNEASPIVIPLTKLELHPLKDHL